MSFNTKFSNVSFKFNFPSGLTKSSLEENILKIIEHLIKLDNNFEGMYSPQCVRNILKYVRIKLNKLLDQMKQGEYFNLKAADCMPDLRFMERIIDNYTVDAERKKVAQRIILLVKGEIDPGEFELYSSNMPEGYHEVTFNTKNLSSGIYFYRIEAGEFQDVKKMILIR